jgi:phytoene dehydrogenase-like protein
MRDRKLLVIGGGLAGLSAGCYALRSGYRTTIVEHNLALGGVCTSWPRGRYTVDGCIHWLTGGPFARVYEELDILPSVSLATLDTWITYRHVRDGIEAPFSRDLDAWAATLQRISRKDAGEIDRLRDGAREFVAMKPPLDAPELATLRDRLHSFWEMRGAVGSLVHFRKSIGTWAHEHIASPALRQMFGRILPPTTPAFFLLMVLGYLEKGWLSRPIGGTKAFRDALEQTYRTLGGEVRLHATVDEVLVRNGRACGVRLADGTMLEADVVVSTASAPETVLRLLGGRFDAGPTRERLEHWKLFDPIVLASFGVARPYADVPSLLVLDGVEPLEIGGRVNDAFYLRVCNDGPAYAPPGHTVVQAMMQTDYDWWATRGSAYNAEKDAIGVKILAALEPYFSEIRAAREMTDVATPLTYWGMARSWRGAYEGWMPTSETFFGHVKKKLAGLDGFYMAGQWVEPGGGVPTAVTSGRQAIELVCADDGRGFRATGGAR